MNKNLYICKTPFQIITSIMLHKNDFAGEKADVVICSTMRDYMKVIKNMQALNIFDNVYSASFDIVNSAITMSMGVLNPGYFLKKSGFCQSGYSRIFTHGMFGDFDNAVFHYNKDAEIMLFDEGYSSYMYSRVEDFNRFSKGHKFFYKLSKLLYGRKYINESAKKIYLYKPELCVNKLPFEVCRISIDYTRMNEFVQIISSIFEIDNIVNEYDSDYIFFEECFGLDFSKNGDMEIIGTIADIVGKDKMMVKLHPRDKTNRFENEGIKTNITVGVPWEALALNMHNTNKTLITFSSGSVISCKFLCNDNSKTILLYKLFPDTYIKKTQEELEWLRKVQDMYKQSIFAPETKEELIHLLKN